MLVCCDVRDTLLHFSQRFWEFVTINVSTEMAQTTVQHLLILASIFPCPTQIFVTDRDSLQFTSF